MGRMMSTIFDILAENNYVTGLANFGGILALSILAYGIVRAVYRFSASAYRQNIKAAIFRMKRRAVLQATLCAMDLHTFVGRVTIRLTITLFALGGVVIGAASLLSSALPHKPSKLFPSLGEPTSLTELLSVFNLVGPFILFMAAGIATVRLAANTLRVRRKILRRLRQKVRPAPRN